MNAGVILTDRQRALLQHLADGHERVRIPSLLEVSMAVYKEDLLAARLTLNARTTVHAVAVALRRELID